MEQGVHVGGWEVVGEIDRGATACVYEGRGGTQGDAIAVEVLLPEPAQDAATRARFLRGAGAQAGVRHPSLVRVHAAGDGPPAPFVVCDLHPGPHLADRLRAGDLPAAEAIDQLGDVAEALDALNGAGVAHGALQPDAILGDGPHALVTGVGRGCTDPDGLVAEPFRAPELTPAVPASPAGDRFALAALAFLALTGGLPFAGGDPVTATHPTAKKAGKKGRRAKRKAAPEPDAPASASVGPLTPTPVQVLRPELPAALDPLFTRALGADPDQRPSSAEALVEAVRDALGPDGLTLGPAPATAALGLPRPAAGPGPTLETVNGTNGHTPTDPFEPSTAVLTDAESPAPRPSTPPPAEAAAPVDDPAAAAVRYIRVPVTAGGDHRPRRRGGGVRRWFARLLALIMVLAAGGAIYFVVHEFLDNNAQDDSSAPALPDGLYTLGSALTPGGVVSRDCRSRVGNAGSPGCSVLQVGLVGADGKGRRLIVKKPSTIRAWAVRGAKGSVAIQVVRRVADGTEQIARSESIDVPDTGVHRYKVNLPISPGDHVGLLLGPGASMGVRLDQEGAQAERWLPPLGKSVRRKPTFSRTSFPHELMLRVDLATKSSEAKSGG